jgi:hypothetical protein
MNMLRMWPAAAATAVAFAATTVPASAATAVIFAFTNGGSGTVTFAVADMSQSAMPATSGAPSYTLIAQTSSSTGSITLTAPTVRGASGAVIPATAFQAKCTETSDNQNMFTTTGLVRLASSPVSCGTLAPNVLGSVTFTISLYLDDTGDANGFPADTYTSGSLSVTANVP